MTKHEQYNIQFTKIVDAGNEVEYMASHSTHTMQAITISRKINQMHLFECRALIAEITTAQNGQPFEPFFDLDHSLASDYDNIEIKTNNTIVFDGMSFPLADIKAILQEWVAFAKH